VASGFRHRANPHDNVRVNPVRSAVPISSSAPACDTTPRPPRSTDNFGYRDVDLLTRLVLRSCE
jgi:hypothetical protein